MDISTSYSRQLRSLGQSLEAQRIQVFELACRGERFVVKGEPERGNLDARRPSPMAAAPAPRRAERLIELHPAGSRTARAPGTIPTQTVRSTSGFLQLTEHYAHRWTLPRIERCRTPGAPKAPAQLDSFVAQPRRSSRNGRAKPRVFL